MNDVVHSNLIDILYRGFCPCSKDRDVFKNYRSIMPKRFQTPSKRFSRFLLIFVLCSIASGPLNSWPTIEPLLGELHVLGSTFNHSSVQLNEVQTLIRLTAKDMGIDYNSVMKKKRRPQSALLLSRKTRGFENVTLASSHNYNYNTIKTRRRPRTAGARSTSSRKLITRRMIHSASKKKVNKIERSCSANLKTRRKVNYQGRGMHGRPKSAHVTRLRKDIESSNRLHFSSNGSSIGF